MYVCVQRGMLIFDEACAVAQATHYDCGLYMQAFVKQRGHDVSQWLRVGGVKAFADGSLGSGTARFHLVKKSTIHRLAPFIVFRSRYILPRFTTS